MVNILVRSLDVATAAQLKKKAKSAGKSPNVFVCEGLHAAARRSKQEAWAEADRIRKKIGKYPRFHGDHSRAARHGEP